MLSDVPAFIPIIFILTNAVVAVMAVIALVAGWKRLSVAPETIRARTLTFIALLAGWGVLTAILGYSGFYRQFEVFPPRALVFGLLPLTVLITYLSLNKAVNRLLTVLPERWLIDIQAFRIFIELVFWWLFLEGKVAELLTFEGRNYDILVGLTAPLIGYLCFGKKLLPKKVAIIWNVAGLLILLNIIFHGVTSAPLPVQIFYTEPPNTFMFYFPYIWIPLFAAPLGLYIHILSLKQLRGVR